MGNLKNNNIYLALSRYEIFLLVEGHEDYEVSNYGRIRHILKSGKIVKIKPTDNDWRGYKRVMLYKNGKRTPYYVHRLVAKAFVAGY